MALDYARTRATGNVHYIEADYLVDALPDDFDVATLIYFDFCALAPGDRARLLGRIHDLLEPGGTKSVPDGTEGADMAFDLSAETLARTGENPDSGDFRHRCIRGIQLQLLGKNR